MWKKSFSRYLYKDLYRGCRAGSYFFVEDEMKSGGAIRAKSVPVLASFQMKVGEKARELCYKLMLLSST